MLYFSFFFSNYRHFDNFFFVDITGELLCYIIPRWINPLPSCHVLCPPGQNRDFHWSKQNRTDPKFPYLYHSLKSKILKCATHPVSLQYPLQCSYYMGDTILLAFNQRSLWPTVVVHIHFGDKSPTIPEGRTGDWGVKLSIGRVTDVVLKECTFVLLHLKQRNLLCRERQGGVQKLAGWQVHVQVCLSKVHWCTSVKSSAHCFSWSLCENTRKDILKE